jgi:hypothetical protein
MPGDTGHDPSRQHGQSGGVHIGQIVQIIVDRLALAGIDVAQQGCHAAFGFTGKQ